MIDAMGELQRPILIEGYASVFGLADDCNDIVRPGAFQRSLSGGRMVPMLIHHRAGARAGRWLRIVEDGYGLFVRGLVETRAAGVAIASGLDGLSIGFRPSLWRIRAGGGRELIAIDLVEISLVAAPMQRRARLSVIGGLSREAA